MDKFQKHALPWRTGMGGEDEEGLCQEESPHHNLTMVASWPWTSSFQNCQKINFCCVSHLAHNILLLQPEQTKTHLFQENVLLDPRFLIQKGMFLNSKPVCWHSAYWFSVDDQLLMVASEEVSILADLSRYCPCSLLFAATHKLGGGRMYQHAHWNDVTT